MGASYGNAFLAAVAIDKAKKQDISSWNPVIKKITAKPNATYTANFKTFKELYEKTKELMRQL